MFSVECSKLLTLLYIFRGVFKMSVSKSEIKDVVMDENGELGRPVYDSLDAGDLSVDDVKKMLPNTLKKQVTTQMVNALNVCGNNPYERDLFRRNFIGFSSVLSKGRYTSTDYLNAVKFCSYRLMNNKVTDAYKKAFPERVKRMLDDGMADEIGVYAAQYNRNKLVVQIYEQSLPPAYLLNVDIYQEAINTQANIMRTAKSDKVRSDAADSLMKHLKAPEDSVTQIEVNVNHGSEIDELREITRKLAQEQLESIKSGRSTAVVVAQQGLLAKPAEVDIDDVEF